MQAKNSGIRAVQGTAEDALTFFKNQVNHFTIKEVKLGAFEIHNCNGLTFTYRASSKYGALTIDVNGTQGF
ncbi:hypothetical protein [Desulforamulus aeronauticus]|uniref:Uncharacterized protein n=1 Tax=Desulforamulus aeronauticus DSM 10349 TaxID=1121421 RepID=A0A1M6XES0_9FIRM|nr:hypothetical protein [Desulforamulus aeronauticus]SHL04431.1 hypothetical protein SAMN02745123_04008 [Desulforamulus aeronauticus DSM 10349]